MVPIGPRSTAIAPASMNHCAILSWIKTPSLFSLFLVGGDADHRKKSDAARASRRNASDAGRAA